MSTHADAPRTRCVRRSALRTTSDVPRTDDMESPKTTRRGCSSASGPVTFCAASAMSSHSSARLPAALRRLKPLASGSAHASSAVISSLQAAACQERPPRALRACSEAHPQAPYRVLTPFIRAAGRHRKELACCPPFQPASIQVQRKTRPQRGVEVDAVCCWLFLTSHPAQETADRQCSSTQQRRQEFRLGRAACKARL